MPRSYTVIAGDDFDSIARKQYGDDQQSGRIRRSNPGASIPLIPGTTLTIPDDQTVEQAGNRIASSENEVAIRINGQSFRFWDSVSISLSIDAVPTVAITSPFEPDNAEIKQAFKPFSFYPVDIDVGGDRLFTGTMVSAIPTTSPNARTLSAACYALPGVMGDCTAPASAYPIEWDNATLRTIAKDVASLFGLTVEFDGDAGPVFERLSLNIGEAVLPWLASLANQRDLVITATEQGALLFIKAASSGKAVALLTEGQSPLIDIKPNFNPQSYYSSITGITPMLVGLKGPQHTEKNKFLTSAIRPHTFSSDNTQGADLNASVRGKMGRMFANVVTYDIDLATWRDPQGELWKPNSFITINAPGAMIYANYTFLVKSVTLSKSSGEERATLELILPGSFAGQVPESLPWDA